MDSDPPFPFALQSSGDARRLLAPAFQGALAEKVAVLHLGDGGRLLALREYPGGADEADLPLRTIVEEALRLGTHGVIVAHNHPSGDANPSAEDLRVSRIVADTLRNLGMRLVDHLIFAGDDVRSLRDLGLI